MGGTGVEWYNEISRFFVPPTHLMRTRCQMFLDLPFPDDDICFHDKLTPRHICLLCALPFENQLPGKISFRGCRIRNLGVRNATYSTAQVRAWTHGSRHYTDILDILENAGYLLFT